MYHAYNVIKYITGDFYNASSIEEDIRLTVKDYKNGKQNDAMYKFFVAVSNFIYQHQQECYRFAAVVMNDRYPNEFHSILEYYNMPFRYSRNPLADKVILEEMCNTENLSLDQAIMGLIGNYNYEQYNGNQEFLNRINFIFNFQPLTWSDLGKSQRVGWMEKMPSDPNQIVAEYNQVLANPMDPTYAKKVGNYGEYMFNSYLQGNYNNNYQIIWVSKDVGDGFGYDFAVLDLINNKLDLYEVKTTTKDEYFVETQLNEYESRICNLTRDYEDTDYHIIKILLGNDVRMVDIDDKSETVTNLYTTNESYKVLKRSANFLNSYMTIEN